MLLIRYLPYTHLLFSVLQQRVFQKLAFVYPFLDKFLLTYHTVAYPFINPIIATHTTLLLPDHTVHSIYFVQLSPLS